MVRPASDDVVKPNPLYTGIGLQALPVRSRCPSPDPFTGSNCKRRGCRHCGRGWVASWEAVSRLNLAEYAGPVVLITVTPPGQRALPWSCDRQHAHGAKYGCQVKADFADAWAEHAPANWRRLRDAARLAVKRAGLPVDTICMERVWEPQKRGVPHLHIVAGVGSPVELEAAQRFAAELRARAPEYGFGEQLHLTKPMVGREAARYLASYLLGRSGRKKTVRENIADPRMPRSLIWLTPRLTAVTGATMRRMRYVRWYLAARRGAVPVWPSLFGEDLIAVARVASRLERGNGPPEQRFREHFRELIAHGAPAPLPVGSDIRPWLHRAVAA